MFDQHVQCFEVSEGYFDHGVAGQCAVQVVQLFSAGGLDGQGDAQVIAGFAGAHFNGGWIEARVELLGHFGHGFCKAVYACTHNLDGKVARIFNQGLFARIVVEGGGVRGAHHGLENKTYRQMTTAPTANQPSAKFKIIRGCILANCAAADGKSAWAKANFIFRNGPA